MNDNVTLETVLGKLLTEEALSEPFCRRYCRSTFSLKSFFLTGRRNGISPHILPDVSAANSFHATGDITLSGTLAASCLKCFVFYLSILDSDSLSYPDTAYDSYCFHHYYNDKHTQKSCIASFCEIFVECQCLGPLRTVAALYATHVNIQKCTYRASTTVASTYILYIRPPHGLTSWEL